MMKDKKTLLLVTTFLLVIAGAFLMKEYNRKPADLADINPVEKLKASVLMQVFEEDENMGNKKYSGKVVEVTGKISSIENEADTLVRVFIETGDPMHKISCTLAAIEIPKIKKFETNQSITIKGYCTGYLMDVELNRCVIVN